MRRTLLAVLVLISTSAIADSPQRRKAWEWTLEQRLALRLDPHAAAERARAAHAAANVPGSAGPPQFVIDGRQTPEVFLPSELMSFLLSSIYIGEFEADQSVTVDLPAIARDVAKVDDHTESRGKLDSASAARVRARYSPTLGIMKWDVQAFWADLDASAAEFVTAMRETRALPRTDEVSRRICASRFVALSEMRKRYDRFDEFLYIAVAPGTVIASDRPATGDWLLWLERGCE